MRAQSLYRPGIIVLLMCVYGAASLLHFVHNAVFLADYPNMPDSLTAAGVYGAWCIVAAVGIAGYILYRHVHTMIGLAVIAVFAVLGFGGLDHYWLAPPGAHSLAMNLTIGFEVVAASALLFEVVRQVVRQWRLR